MAAAMPRFKTESDYVKPLGKAFARIAKIIGGRSGQGLSNVPQKASQAYSEAARGANSPATVKDRLARIAMIRQAEREVREW